MAIGEFGGAARRTGRLGPSARCTRRRPTGSTKWARRRSIRPAPSPMPAAVLQESRQSLVAHRTRQDRRRRLRIVRALDAPLRQAGVEHLLDADRRRARAGAHLLGLGAAVLPAPAFRAHVRASAAASAAEAAHRRADVGPLRDAAARHGRRLPAQPRRLRHRMGRRARGAGVAGQLRSRRLHRLPDLDAALPRRRRSRHRGLPAVGAGAGRGRAHGGRRRPARAAFHGADGRPDRHPDQSDRRSIFWPSGAASNGSAATSSPRCRSRIRASCATSIRASSSSTAS